MEVEVEVVVEKFTISVLKRLNTIVSSKEISSAFLLIVSRAGTPYILMLSIAVLSPEDIDSVLLDLRRVKMFGCFKKATTFSSYDMAGGGGGGGGGVGAGAGTGAATATTFGVATARGTLETTGRLRITAGPVVSFTGTNMLPSYGNLGSMNVVMWDLWSMNTTFLVL